MWIISFALGVWVLILSILVFGLMRHYNRLTHGVTKSGLTDVLEKILTGQHSTAKKIVDLENALQFLSREGKRHIARIGVVRFNPFADTGGSQSFTMAILDSANCGIVMTSLFARSGNRWYVKEIRNGAGKDFALSKEEERAIKIAQPL